MYTLLHYLQEKVKQKKNPKLYNMCGKFITLMNGNRYIIGEKLQTFDINLELISKILIVWDSVESDYV